MENWSGAPSCRRWRATLILEDPLRPVAWGQPGLRERLHRRQLPGRLARALRPGWLRAVDPTVSHRTQSVLPIFWGTVHLPDAKAARVLSEESLGGRPGGWADHAAAWCARRTRRALSLSVEAETGPRPTVSWSRSCRPCGCSGLRTAERCRTGLRTSGQQTGGSDQPGEGSVAVVRHRQDQLGDIGYLQLLGSQCELPYGKYSAEVRCDLRRVAAIMAVNLGLITL